jgi:hypothetical protein
MKIPACIVLLVLSSGALTSCTHVAGVVLGDRTERPVANAEFTVGPPNMMVLDRHRVDSNGHFDFFISPIDETNLYVWNGQGDPSLGPRHIDPTEISSHMTIHLVNPYEIQAP